MGMRSVAATRCSLQGGTFEVTVVWVLVEEAGGTVAPETDGGGDDRKEKHATLFLHTKGDDRMHLRTHLTRGKAYSGVLHI